MIERILPQPLSLSSAFFCVYFSAMPPIVRHRLQSLQGEGLFPSIITSLQGHDFLAAENIRGMIQAFIKLLVHQSEALLGGDDIAARIDAIMNANYMIGAPMPKFEKLVKGKRVPIGSTPTREKRSRKIYVAGNEAMGNKLGNFKQYSAPNTALASRHQGR